MTGLIYIVIIALWVAVLVPMWLRRHDQISELRSTAKFSRSMQRLERAERTARESAMAVHPSNQRKAVVVHNPDAQTEAARRRAVVLGLLSGTLFVTLVLAMLSLLPIAAPITMAGLVVAFMVATALTAPARARQAQGVSSRTPSRRRRPAAAELDVEPAATTSDEDDFLSWNAWDEDDDAWEAVPTTLPTYVTAPKASAVPRPIDKVSAGAWTGEAMVDAARQMRRHESEQLAHVDAREETAEIPVVRPATSIAVNQ